jgi:hypothetical protein
MNGKMTDYYKKLKNMTSVAVKALIRQGYFTVCDLVMVYRGHCCCGGTKTE